MNNEKENLINQLVIRLADNTNLSIGELKSQIETTMYNWNVSEIETTELSCHNGDATRELLEYFRIGKLSSNKSPDTVNQYIAVAYQLCNFVNKELNMITAEDIRYFLVVYKRLNHVQDSTMESKRSYLSSIFAYLTKNQKLNINPMNCIEPINCTAKVKQPITQEEFERIVIACNQDRRLLAIVYLLIDTGVRVSELCNIKMSDIDFVDNKIKVLGKRNKERFVYFCGRTKVRLLDYINNDRKDIQYINGNMVYAIDCPLIASVKGGCHNIHKNRIEEIIRTLGKKSGVIRIHPHLFRATFATNMILSGKDLVTVSRLMGHSNLDTTKLYILLSDTAIEHIAKVA